MVTITVREEGKEPIAYSFSSDEVTIGRAPNADLVLRGGSVSKQHARIVRKEGRFFLIDRKSTNGTFLNGKRIVVPSSIKEGDIISIGDFTLGLTIGAAAGATVVPNAPREPDPKDKRRDTIAVAPGTDPASLAAVPPPPKRPQLTEEQARIIRELKEKEHVRTAETAATQPPPPPAEPAAEKAAREAAEKTAREAAEKTAREAAEKTAREAAEKAAREAAEKAAREAAEKTAREAAEKAAREAAEKAAREAAEKAVREAAEKTAREAAERVQNLRVEIDLLRETIWESVADGLFDPSERALAYLYDDETVAGPIRTRIAELFHQNLPDIDEKLMHEGVERLAAELLGFGPLEELLEDDSVRAVVINGPDVIRCEKADGSQTRLDTRFASDESLATVILRLAADAGIEVDETTVTIDTLLPGGLTLTAVLYPHALKGSMAVLRKPFDVEAAAADWRKRGIFNPATLGPAVQTFAARGTILAWAGEPNDLLTLAACFRDQLADNELTVVIESSSQLFLDEEKPSVINLEERIGRTDAGEPVSRADLFRAARGIEPDRLIAPVNTATDSTEIIDLLLDGRRGLFAGFTGPSWEAVRDGALEYYAVCSDEKPASLKQVLRRNVDLLLFVNRGPDGAPVISFRKPHA